MHSAVTLRDGMAFDATVRTHTVAIDAKPEHGGTDSGPSPKELLLVGLGGCTAMDVVSILRKMRQEPATLTVDVQAGQTEDHPVILRDIQVRFEVTGDVKPAKLWRAVALSRDRYCGVQAMLGATASITTSVVLNGEVVPEP